MKVIVAGSRGIEDPEVVYRAIEESPFPVTEIVSGTANGPDTYGETWAMLHDIPVKRMPARWDKYGKSAGIKRNERMAAYADALVAVWDGKSRGTKHMIQEAQDADIPTHVVKVVDGMYQLSLAV